MSVSRQLSGLRNLTSDAAQTTWARHNHMHERIQFHHHLVSVIPPTEYAASHPEFFPAHDPA